MTNSNRKGRLSYMRAFLFIVFLPFAPLSFPQEATVDFSNIDKEVTENGEVFNTYHELTSSLTAPWESEEEKIRAIYYWIISNIDYKEQVKMNIEVVYESGKRAAEAEATFNKRKGKCTGYSSLFESMCKSVNLECYSIVGYAIDNYPCQIEEFTFYDHMWNGCRIQGKWYLLDLTWDSYTLKQTQSTDSLAFLVEPENFIKDHVPANPMWQLLDQPVSINSLCDNTNLISDQSGEVYAYNDTIQKWKNLQDIDKEVFDKYQCYTFNPIMCQPYGAALMTKGLHVAFTMNLSLDSIFFNMDKGRDILVESLLYLKPYQVYNNKNGFYLIKHDNVTAMKRHVIKTIRYIEKALLKIAGPNVSMSFNLQGAQ